MLRKFAMITEDDILCVQTNCWVQNSQRTAYESSENKLPKLFVISVTDKDSMIFLSMFLFQTRAGFEYMEMPLDS